MELFFDMLRWSGSESEIFSYFIYFPSVFPLAFSFCAVLYVIGIISDFAARSWEGIWQSAVFVSGFLAFSSIYSVNTACHF